MANEGVTSTIFSAMQTKTPYKSYKKVILGKVYVNVWNEFEGKPEGLIISGNPRGKDQESCILDIWSEMADMYFRRSNRRLLEMGQLVEFKRKVIEPVIEEKPYAQASDEELTEFLNKKYTQIASELKKIEDIAPLYRLKELAEELDKTEKVVQLIKSRLSEVQEAEYTLPEKTEE